MGVDEVLNSIDKAKENIEIKEAVVEEEVRTFTQDFLEFESKFRNYIIVIINILTIFISSNTYLWLTVMLGSALLYILPILNEYLEYKKEKEMLDSIDINLIGNSLEREDTLNKRSAYDILSEYVINRFENDVLIYHNIKSGDVINSKMEDMLLKDLIESTTANLSPIVRRKFELYFGMGRVDTIIGRLCFITVSMYAARSKKDILSMKPMN